MRRTIHRRHFLGGSAALLGAATLPLRRAFAQDTAVSGDGLKILFVVSYGGWDPTRVFADEFWNPNVDMERSAGPVSIGGLTYISHAERPSVDQFFAQHHSRTLILNGLQVPSVAHENCLRLVMTGSTSSERADWPSIVAHEQAADYALPHIVIQGPAFPGAAGSAVTRTGSSGQLEGLLDGSILGWSDDYTRAPSVTAEDQMDAYLARRLAAVAETHPAASMRSRAASYQAAQARARGLKDLGGVLDWSGGTDLGAQIDLAVGALSLGVSRCAMLSSNYGWDSHTDNDAVQSTNFEGLFSNLSELMDRLAAAPGQRTASLADETLVVVLSEMGRTPQLNPDNGKDHWPYTSAMLIGPRITGDRVVGAFDGFYYGRRIDRATGEVDDGGHDLSVEELGATLMLAAGIDPGDHLTGVQGIAGVIQD
ncbi:MAG: hypothetical protein ACI8S6_002851 [Myxococcota bacterium]|jgi:uncharacterized protein (DUF1501 family)